VGFGEPDECYRLVEDVETAEGCNGELLHPPQLTPTPAPELVATQWIREHFEERVTVAMLARIAKVTERALRKRFQNRFGCSPNAYLSAIRYTRAELSIQQGLKKEVAARLVGLSRSTLYRYERDRLRAKFSIPDETQRIGR
jgi:AraC-like DNA-binding protein